MEKRSISQRHVDQSLEGHVNSQRKLTIRTSIFMWIFANLFIGFPNSDDKGQSPRGGGHTGGPPHRGGYHFSETLVPSPEGGFHSQRKLTIQATIFGSVFAHLISRIHKFRRQGMDNLPKGDPFLRDKENHALEWATIFGDTWTIPRRAVSILREERPPKLVFLIWFLHI